MSILDEGLPPLEDLEPEELQYLRQICEALRKLRWPEREQEDQEDQDFDLGLFDADELGLDPETDNERW